MKMNAEISKSMFAPARLVFFAGEQGGGGIENPEKIATKEVVKDFKEKFESKPLDLQNIENAYREANKRIDEVYEKASEPLLEGSNEKSDLQLFVFEQLNQLDDLKDKYVRLAENNKKEFEENKKKSAQKIAETVSSGEEVGAKQYVDADGKINFKGDKAAEKKITLVDVAKSLKGEPNTGDRYAVYKKGKETSVVATYNGKNFVDDKGKRVKIFSGDRIEEMKGTSILGDKKRVEVKNLFPEDEGAEMAEKGEEKPAEKKDKLTDKQRLFVNTARAINVELNKLLIKYQEKYGDSPKWGAFEQSVLQDIETRTDQVDNVEQNSVSDKINVAQYIGENTPTERAKVIINHCISKNNILGVQIALKEEGLKTEKSEESEGPKPVPAAGFQTIEIPKKIETPMVKRDEKEDSGA